MRNKSILLLSILTVTLLAPAAWAQSVWGSFDTTRINYSSGTLNGGAHTTLRGIIAANSGSVAAGTSTLTGAYLSGVDVFYTSLLSTTTGTLSGAEQTALQNWITGGGTLIVTADIFPLPAYETFTSFYGVTGYSSVSSSGNGTVVASHAITAGVTSFNYTTDATYIYGGDALLLGLGSTGTDFLIVMEPGTGFGAGGRILVFGDHNMFTGGFIGNADNTLLAGNMARWAAVPEPSTLLVLGLGALFFRRRKLSRKS